MLILLEISVRECCTLNDPLNVLSNYGQLNNEANGWATKLRKPNFSSCTSFINELKRTAAPFFSPPTAKQTIPKVNSVSVRTGLIVNNNHLLCKLALVKWLIYPLRRMKGHLFVLICTIYHIRQNAFIVMCSKKCRLSNVAWFITSDTMHWLWCVLRSPYNLNANPL